MLEKTIKLLIIVPARSGSKGITDKNIKLLANKPLLYWTAKAINEANLSNSLSILSTDSKQYEEIGAKYGLEVPFLRPSHLCQDETSAIEVIAHSLDWFNHTYQYEPELIMWLQPTSPFRTAKHIKSALTMIQCNNTDSVIACQQIYRDQTTLFNTELGYLVPLAQGKLQQRRQEVKTLLTPNGLMYLIKTKYFKKSISFYPEKTVPLICDKISSIDIDTEEDWLLTESIMDFNKKVNK